MKKDVKNILIQSAVMNTKKRENKIMQLVIKNLSKEIIEKNEYMKK